MKKLPSVAICIPAYNEQFNIDHLLKQLLKQKQDSFVIERIIVASDGSKDETVKIAKKYADRGVEVIDGKENRGQTYRQNEIISKVTSDILVLLNADLHLKGSEVILKLVEPVLHGIDLTAQWAKPVKPRTFFERILVAGFYLKYFIYISHNQGKNIYTCVGHMRALSKRFYQSVSFPEVSYGEDQFLYLLCKSRGYTYVNINQDNTYFKLPETVNDYFKYAKRIFQTQQKFEDIFGEEFVRKERLIPTSIKFYGLRDAIKRYPFYTPLYILVHFVVQRWALRQPVHTSHVFEISASTKIIANIE